MSADKKVETWMPLLVDKYLGDTTDLTTEQHGAYLLLLMSCWKKGGLLPLADERLRAITRLDPDRWEECRDVVMPFFERTPEGYRQKRLTAELARAKANVEQRSAAGKASAAARKAQREGNGDSTGVATDGQREPQREPERNVKPRPRPSSLRSEKTPPNPLPGEPWFVRFWDAWPSNTRKAARAQCLAKWRAKGCEAIGEKIVAHVEALKQSDQWQRDGGRYVPAPLVYLNQARWESATADQPWHATRSGVEAKGVELGLGKWDEHAFSIGMGEAFAAYEARVCAAAERAALEPA